MIVLPGAAREWYASYFLKKSSWEKGKRRFSPIRHFVAESIGQNFSSASLCRFISRQREGEKQGARELRTTVSEREGSMDGCTADGSVL